VGPNALPAKYRPLYRMSRRKTCPFFEVQPPRFQQGGAEESDPEQTWVEWTPSGRFIVERLAQNRTCGFRANGLNLG